MDKKESLNKKEDLAAPKVPGLSAKAFGIIKFILGICLLPMVYAVSAAFLNEFSLVDKALQDVFWCGIVVFLIIYLFVWEPVFIYLRGQKILEILFAFVRPLVRVAPYLLPIYTIILFLFYLLASLVLKQKELVNYFVFLAGFSIALHLVFGAKSLRTKQGDFLKGNYIFGFSFVYIVNVVIAALIINFVFDKFSFVNFSSNSFQTAKNVFYAVFKQLFLR